MEASELIDIKFLDGDPPADRARWEEAIRKAFGRGFGKARLRRDGDQWQVDVVLIHEPSQAQKSETLPAPRDGRDKVVAALREAGLPVKG